jgi:hypothetical protein
MLTPQDTLPRKKGRAAGVYFTGQCVTLRLTPESPAFAIVARDAEMIREIWEKLVKIPLNENGIQDVALFRESNTIEEN